MSQQQTVLRVQFDNVNSITGITEYEFLDLYSDVPIKINKSFAELQDISKRNSDYSIGLKLPGSKKNNKFFENFFNVDTQSLYFNVLQRVTCNVLLDDQSYFTGYLRLNKVGVLDSKIEYDVTLYSSIGDLFGNIGNNLLKDLDYDQDVLGYDNNKFNHTFNKYEVQSWADTNPYGSVNEPLYFYPIVHNGYNYSGDTVNLSGTTPSLITSGVTRLYTTTIAGSFTSNATAYSAGVKRYRINSPEDGLIDNQLKPALSIRGLITLMFQNYGYTIKSDFFNTPWFRMLYMYGYFSSEATKFSYKVPPKSDAASTDLAVKLTETFVDVLEGAPCNNIKTTRTYTIQLVYKDTGVVTTTPTPINIKLLFKYFDCGQTVGYDVDVPITISPNTTGTTYSWISNQFIPCPSACKLQYKQNFGVNDGESDVPEYSNLAPNTIVIYEDNDVVDFSLVIDWNLKQIDVLSSIAKKFNLVFVPDPDVQNQIIIEPYNYYIGTGDVHDWTPKLSYDKGFTVEPALNYVESELILSDLEDGDYGNKTFKDRNNRLYGENKVYNPTAFKSQSKKIDTVFSPELVRQWDTLDTAPNGQVKLPLGINYASNSSSQNSGGSEKIVWTYPGVKTKPKLMYWSGNFNPFLDEVGEVINYSGYVLTNIFYIAESDGSSPRQSTVAPIVGTTMPVGNPDNNKINNDSICNLFNSELPTDLGVTSFSAYTENDMYSLFYQNRVDNLYNPNTRFLKGYFNLKYNDIQNLKPNDLIKINEQYFTWNKIDGFNLTNRELTQVELIQTNNNPSEYPTRYFMYYYCDNTSNVFKFKTDMTNPNLNETNYGWSSLYDYNVGVLGGNVSGYTSTFRDYQCGTDGYVPYHIYEVSETTYNASGYDRQYDTFYNEKIGLNFGYLISMPTYVYTNNVPTQIISNIFIDCTNFNYYKTNYNIATVSSTYYGTYPKTCTGYTATNTGSTIFGFSYIDCDGNEYSSYLPSGNTTTICIQGHIPCIIQGGGTFTSPTNCLISPTPTPTLTTTPTPTPPVVCYDQIPYTPAIGPLFELSSKKVLYNDNYTNVGRLLQNGGIDGTFTTGSTNYGFYFFFDETSTNKIIFGSIGGFTFYNGVSAAGMILLNSDGTIDYSFNSAEFYNGSTLVGARPIINSNDKIICRGNFTQYAGVTANRIVRLNLDGTIDLNYGSGFNRGSIDFTLLNNNKLIAFANSNPTSPTYQGSSFPYIIRINDDGSKDTSFNPGTGPSATIPSETSIQQVYELSNNKLLVEGIFTSWNGTPVSQNICRLNSNGSLDTTFNVGNLGFGTKYEGARIGGQQSSGKIILYGSYGVTYNGSPRSGIFRINYDGSYDPTFINGSTDLSGGAEQLIVLSNNKIVLAAVGSPISSIQQLLEDGALYICPTPTPTPTPSGTPNASPTRTPTSTPPITPTQTGTPAVTPTGTPAVTPTATPTATFGATPTGTPAVTTTPTPTGTPAPTPVQFSMTINTTAEGSNYVVGLPYYSGGTYSGTINWGDGSTSGNTYANNSHTYVTGGTYTITITGTINGFNTGYNTVDGVSINRVLTSINQFGTNFSFGPNDPGKFERCKLLTSVASDIPLSGVNFKQMFNLCTVFNQDISSWNVSIGGDNMRDMFRQTSFNQNINSWNVSGVIDMKSMFQQTPFNQPLSGWNVSNVTNMIDMFNASSFNQNIGGWNVSGVTSMSGMLIDATSFTTTNLNNIYNGWSALPSLQSNVPFGASVCYTATTGRGILTGTYNWTITDGGVC